MRKPISIFGTILVWLLMVWWIPTFGEALPRSDDGDRGVAAGMLPRDRYVPWAAQFSEALEEISPALQATGWAFYGLVDARMAGDLGATVDLRRGQYGWAAWMKFSLGGIIFYIVAMA